MRMGLIRGGCHNSRTRRAATRKRQAAWSSARYRTRSGTSWVGYIVHLSETCEDEAVHLITHAMTMVATVHEARCTAAIYAALAGKGPCRASIW